MDLPLKISECSIGMVEELLGNLSDWRGTQDIIRMTLKALTEVVKTHTFSISNINKHVSGLVDVQMMQEYEEKINKQLGKYNLNDLEEKLSEKISKKEMQAALNTKASLESVKEKVDVEEFYNECKMNNLKIEKVQAEFNRKILEIGISDQLQRLNLEIKEKPSWNEVQEALEQKIDKSLVNSLMQKKANKTEIEESLKNKAEISDLLMISNKIEVKIDKNLFETQINAINQKIAQNSEGISNKIDDEKVFELESKIKEIQKTLKIEFEAIKKSLVLLTSKKVDCTDFESLCETVKNKADYKETSEIFEKVSKEFKITISDLRKNSRAESKKKNQPDENFEKLNEEIGKIRNQMIDVLEDRKKDTIEHSVFLKNITSQMKKELKEEYSKLSEKFDEFKEFSSNNFVKKIEIQGLKNEIKQLFEGKINKEEANLLLAANKQEILKGIKKSKTKFKEDMIKIEKKIETIPQVPKEKTPFSDLLITKAEKSDLESFSSKLHSLFSDFSLLKSELTTLSNFFNAQFDEIRRISEELSKECKLKSNTKEILALVDNKANINDTNKALIEIHKELDGKIDNEYHTRQMSGLEQSLSVLWNANYIARWAWKSGELRHSNAVPWEFQICNTVPEVFMWEKDKSSILVMNSGIYFVNLAIFSKKKLRVQVMVNAEVGLDTGNKPNITANNVIHEFIVLNARSRVSVTFFGDLPAQGYLELIKFT